LIRALKQERDRLAASLAEKDVLLKEVHHRVKNNLQVVASLLRLQAGSFSNPELEAALIESQNRVESMALVHEQLYATEDVREVDLAQHIEMLAANLLRGYGDPTRISVLADVQPVSLGINQAIPVSLILNELISNALKHAFPGGRPGSIRIEGRARNGRIFLAVRDDGEGMPESAEPRRPKSLGLEIVKILTAQLKGEFEIDRSCGTSFRIAFPHHVN
jgi:two-component sensor histidine kinase